MFDRVDISVFLATAQPEACRDFYTKTMGLTLQEENDFALVFALKGVELRISKVPSFSPHPFTVLDWQVDDLNEAMAKLSAGGVSFEIFDGMGQDEKGIWQVPGEATKIAWFKDPDDNVLSISQRAK